jgi:hypothetical protein
MSGQTENYLALMQLPIVQKLLKKNRELKQKNKALKAVLYNFNLIFDFKEEKQKKNKKLRTKIKTETEEPTLCDTLTDDDDVVFVCSHSEDGDEAAPEVVNLVSDEEEEEEEEEVLADVKPNIQIKLEEPVTEEVEEEEEEEEEEEAEEETATPAAQQPEEEEEEEEEEEDQPEIPAAKEGASGGTLGSPEPEEEEGSVFEITIKGKTYYTDDDKNGAIYSILEDEDVGPQVGVFKDGVPKFTKK